MWGAAFLCNDKCAHILNRMKQSVYRLSHMQILVDGLFEMRTDASRQMKFSLIVSLRGNSNLVQ